jgi:hypothetical protein
MQNILHLRGSNLKYCAFETIVSKDAEWLTEESLSYCYYYFATWLLATTTSVYCYDYYMSHSFATH